MAPISRSYSEKYSPGNSEFDLYKNKNVDWSSGFSWKIVYMFVLIFLWWFLSSFGLFPKEDLWTVINVFHCVVC